MGSAMLQVRARCVARFRSLEQAGQLPPDVEQRIRNQYAPDLSSGWGLEAVQARPLPLAVPLLICRHELFARLCVCHDGCSVAAVPCMGSCMQLSTHGLLCMGHCSLAC